MSPTQSRIGAASKIPGDHEVSRATRRRHAETSLANFMITCGLARGVGAVTGPALVGPGDFRGAEVVPAPLGPAGGLRGQPHLVIRPGMRALRRPPNLGDTG